MLEIKRILCPVDFSEFSASAYRHAVSLAEHYGAKLYVQHIVEIFRYPSMGFATSAGLYQQFCEALVLNGREKLEEFLKNHAHHDLQPERVVAQGTAADAILAFAEVHQVDLIVMGTHGRRGFDRLMLGSVTERVVRRASCPVLAGRNLPQDIVFADNPRGPAHLHRILFCTDFSENSHRALNYAISVATEYHAELTLLNVLDDILVSANMEQAVAGAKELLSQLIPAGECRTCKIETSVRVGKPYEQIIQFAADSQTDMVVMAVRGRGSLDLAVFGSTTQRVLQLGPCPVLVIHD